MTRAEILDCLTDRPCDSCKFHESGRCERWNCVFEEKPDDVEDCEDKRMTREEAIGIMKVIIHMLEEKYDTDRVEDAVDLAIEALSAEPCEDCISRQAARKIILDEFEGWPTDEEVAQLKRLTKQIDELPSVTPKQKMCFDGMTNGEVIDLLFPNTDIYHNRDFTLREMVFPDEWWNEPYKAESEDT